MKKSVIFVISICVLLITACGVSDAEGKVTKQKTAYEGTLSIGEKFIEQDGIQFIFAGIQNDSVVINHLENMVVRTTSIEHVVQSYYIPFNMKKYFKLPSVDTEIRIKSVNVEDGTIDIELNKW